MELYWESIFGYHDVQDIILVYVGFVYILINLLFLINLILILSINPIILPSISITDYRIVRCSKNVLRAILGTIK